MFRGAILYGLGDMWGMVSTNINIMDEDVLSSKICVGDISFMVIYNYCNLYFGLKSLSGIEDGVRTQCV